MQPRRRRGYTAWPERPGQMNFDLNNEFRETPYQNSNRGRTSRAQCTVPAAAVYTTNELIEMNSDQHAQLVADDLDNIRQKFDPDYYALQSLDKLSTDPSSSLTTDRTDTPIRDFAVTVEDDNELWVASFTDGYSASPLHSEYDSHEMGTPDEALSQLFDEPVPPSELSREFETRAITVSQLIQEVKGIYAGLVMVEKKCTEILTQQAETPTKLSKEQWQALIALHRTLLNEHHDFFVATHHPTAPWELRQLALKYAIPTRLWKRNLYPLLGLIRQHAEDGDYMQYMVQVIFSSLTELKRKVPAMEHDWREIALNLHTYITMLRYFGIYLPETDAEITSRSMFVHVSLILEWIKGFASVLKQAWDHDALAHGEATQFSCTPMRYSEVPSLSSRGSDTQQRLNTPSMAYDRRSIFEQFLPEEDLSGSIFSRLQSNHTLWALMVGWYHAEPPGILQALCVSSMGSSWYDLG